jgi:hypothetical protein
VEQLEVLVFLRQNQFTGAIAIYAMKIMFKNRVISTNIHRVTDGVTCIQE